MFENTGVNRVENRVGNRVICEKLEEEAAVNNDVCSEVHLFVLALAFNKVIIGKTIFCFAMFCSDTVQDVAPTLHDKHGSS